MQIQTVPAEGGTASHRLGLFSATSLVIANIIGTGIFTTTGFLAADLPSHFALLFIWAVGGVLALCGALSYGELAAAMPRSGGEYHYLSRIYHPALGFVSGFVSIVAGFSAPVAASAKAFGRYASTVVPAIDPTLAAATLVVLMTVLHSLNLSYGSRVQNAFTVLKVLLIVVFIGAGLTMSAPQTLELAPGAAGWDAVTSAGFAVGLVYVSFSYSGWNAAAYMSGEIDRPQRNVPVSLLIGTLIVMALYLLLNFVFLRSAPISAIAGQEAVGDIAARHIFGQQGGELVSTLISLALVSSVSSMVMAGPRVAMTMGEDIPAFRVLSRRNAEGIPAVALYAQMGIALGFIFSAKLESIIQYIGFTLNLFAFLSVLGVYVLRRRMSAETLSYRTFGYPLTPALFLLLSGWMTVHMVRQRPIESAIGFITLAVGFVLYFVLTPRAVRNAGGST